MTVCYIKFPPRYAGGFIISAELKTLRQDVKLCDASAARSLEIANRNAQLKQIEEREIERKREQERKRSKTHIR